MSKLERLRKEYEHALRSTYVDRGEPDVGRTYDLVDEAAADALITALEAEARKWEWVAKHQLLATGPHGQEELQSRVPSVVTDLLARCEEAHDD